MQFQFFSELSKLLKQFFDAIGLGDAFFLVMLMLVVGLWWLHRWNVKQLEEDKKKGSQGLRDEAERVGRPWLEPTSYRGKLGSALTRVDRSLGEHPWGPNTFDFCLRLAVVYPLASVLLVWVVTGLNTSGISGFLPEADLGRRLFGLIGIGFSAFAFWKYLSEKGRKRFVWLAFAFAFATGAGTAGPGAFAVASVAAFAAAVIFAFAFAAPVAAPVAAAGAGAGAVAFIGAVAVASAVAFAGTGAGAVAVAFAFTVASTVAVAVAVAVFYIHEELTQAGRPSIGHGVFVMLLMSVILFIVWLQPSSSSVAYAPLFFLGVLPLVNVVFDWGSIGLTRWLLRRTHQGHSAWLNAAIDIVSALAILVLLAIATVATVQSFNLLAQSSGATAPLVDVAGLLATLRDKPGDPSVWWIYAILFSTLLPSALHGCLAAGTLITARLVPPTWLEAHRVGLRQAYKEGTLEGNRRLLLYHARLMTLRNVTSAAVVLVCLVLVVAIPTGLGIFIWQYFGQLLLWACEGTAAALGAPVQPILPDPSEILRGGGFHV
jgi:hypothetical protein